MIRTVNRLNAFWNRTIYRFHDASVRLNSPKLVKLSIWGLNHLIWTLPEEWTLINGTPVREYNLQRELEVARHQIQYYMDYAYELQWQIIQEEPRRKRTKKPVEAAKQETPTLTQQT